LISYLRIVLLFFIDMIMQGDYEAIQQQMKADDKEAKVTAHSQDYQEPDYNPQNPAERTTDERLGSD
jgi:hypothetical protein